MPTGGSTAGKLGWQIACLCLLGVFVPALVTSLGYSLTDSLGPGPGFFPFWLSLIGAVLSAAMLAQVTLAKTDEGIAISLCDSSERGYLRDIERLIRTKIEVIPHELPELTEEQRRQMEEPRRSHGHRHGGHGKPHGNKGGGHKPGGHAKPGGHGGQREAGEGHNPHAPKKRNGSRPHWHRGKDKARGSAA